MKRGLVITATNRPGKKAAIDMKPEDVVKATKATKQYSQRAYRSANDRLNKLL